MYARDTTASACDAPATCYAPATRSSPEELKAELESLQSAGGFLDALDFVPEWIVVLNRNRQAVWANAALASALGVADRPAIAGMRPGELVGCIHSDEWVGGCGTSRSCRTCGAADVILKCLDARAPVAGECRITTRSVDRGGTLNLKLSASFLAVGGTDLVLLVLQDLGAERRLDVLERTVFHDTLDSVSAIYTLCGMLPPEAGAAPDGGLAGEMRRLSCEVIEEIRALQTLLAAETGDLVVRPEEASLREFLSDVHTRYRAWDLAEGCIIQTVLPSDACMRTDVALLLQVLDDLVRNALEATDAGGVVHLSARMDDGHVVLAVHNAGVMPPEVRAQVFQRAFSTKGTRGRGVGTYRARLIAVRYLHGDLSFVSAEPEGTTFTVRIPAGLDS